MKNILVISLIVIGQVGFSQNSYQSEIEKFQTNLNEEFKNPEESPLTKKERKKFKEHNFFPTDETYQVTADFVKADDPATFQMKTTTNRLPTYDKYGYVKFSLKGNEYQLTIYQSHTLRETDEYRNYLFLPFTDLTNGEETYGGGRYIDLSIPDGNQITIDFNKAYSPYCAYNYSFSCPIPPAENNMDIRIEAGVKNLKL